MDVLISIFFLFFFFFFIWVFFFLSRCENVEAMISLLDFLFFFPRFVQFIIENKRRIKLKYEMESKSICKRNELVEFTK